MNASACLLCSWLAQPATSVNRLRKHATLAAVRSLCFVKANALATHSSCCSLAMSCTLHDGAVLLVPLARVHRLLVLEQHCLLPAPPTPVTIPQKARKQQALTARRLLERDSEGTPATARAAECEAETH